MRDSLQQNPHIMIYLRFYEELNDFLPRIIQKKEYAVKDLGKRTVKDLIEAQGVPHSEVDLILVNGESVNFNYIVKNNDHISVYPMFESLDISTVTKLREKPLRDPRFILDVHLGKLARYLRLLGFDTVYSNLYNDEEIAVQSYIEKRILLTRDKGILKRSEVIKGYWLRSEKPREQVHEILRRFDLFEHIQPFTYCLSCNSRIFPVPKEKIEHLLHPDTKTHFNEFFQCRGCRKVYWKGSHYDKMLAWVNALKPTDVTLASQNPADNINHH